MEKNKSPKPYRQLLPVIILQAINLIIYLYVISVNGTSLNLVHPGQKDITFLIVVGSYISTTIATLLTLTSYFSVKAFVKRFINEPIAPIQPKIAQKEEKSQSRDAKQGLLVGLFKREKGGQVSQKASTPLVNKQVEPKSVEIAELQQPKKEEPVTIKNNKSNWKTIGVKATDEVTKIVVNENKLISEKQEPLKEVSKENELKPVIVKTPDFTVTEKKTQDPENKEKTPEIKSNSEQTPPMQPLVGDAKSLSPDNQLENPPQDEHYNDYVELESEVIQTLEELKQMVEKMKTSKKGGGFN